MPARDIKRRIRSIANTRQITRAMKFVATAKLRRAQERMLALRPYAERLNDLLRHLAPGLSGDEHPLFRPAPAHPKRVGIVLVAADRGLCGGFNAGIVRAARKTAESLPPGTEALFYCVGRRGAAGIAQDGRFRVVKRYSEVFDQLSFALSGLLCSELVDRVLSADDGERLDSVMLVYNRFVNMLSQEPVVETILPFDLARLGQAPEAEASEDAVDDTPSYVIEPDAVSALAPLVSRLVATDVHRALLESHAAELAARMAAMDSASHNAGDMIDRLTLKFNRARQAGITGELIDIVGGANALE